MTKPVDRAQFDLLGQGAMGGTIAQTLLANNFNVNSLRTQATLRRDEWKMFDDALTEVSRQKLTGISDLMSAGLTYALPNAMGKTHLEWEKVSDLSGAEISMSGVTAGQNDHVDFGNDSMPIPIVHKDFSLNVRHLAASRERGMPLDTMQAAYAGLKVSEALESMLFLGTTVLGANAPIYGYTTASSRNTGSVTATWTTATGAQIVADILRMLAIAYADHMYGPFQLYVPLAVMVHLSDDFKANGDLTILQRILEIPGITGVKMSEYLTSSNIVMVQMTRNVIDLVDGIQPTIVQWETNGGFTFNFKVLAIMPPRIKTDYLGQSGIVHFS